MATGARKTLLTAGELPALSSRLSSEGKRAELVEGELIVTAPAGGRHGRIANTIAYFLTRFSLSGHGGTVFAAETGFLLRSDPDTVRAPNVAFISSDRLGPDDAPPGYLEMAPDLAVEVVSPNDSAASVQSKVEDWLGTGTRLVWVVYPDTQSVAVYRSLHEAEVLSEPDALDGAPVLSGFAVPVRDLFTQQGQPRS